MISKVGSFLLLSLLLFACGRENRARMDQFDLLEQSATSEPIKYYKQKLQLDSIQIDYPHFGGHPFTKLMQHLLKKDTLGAFCVGQRSVHINYKVLWATDKVLSLNQEVWLDCPMSEGTRKTVVNYLFTRKGNQISRLFLEGSPGLLQTIEAGLRKRQTPYCSPPKIEEVFPIIKSGRVEVTPHYASSLCDTTFKRKGIHREDLRIVSNQTFLSLN
ncbi:MAG: hypothetical protein NWS92_03695 [Crocinitomicaceae bacterium]|jgi:hypothetical protein|nr:hypothetical protein [Crocinitomicaceae bacterium]MDP4724347.1 hypothetical protein [Crocinitomicaceae bacterium]MDP4739472.1 hypothetical protein [Crocinitomicaceae bacterium]MDP4799713.1 hypothetical protein [Crocinitomicaceae bacterium]MDP4807369.1 hypothetical protein [Crocinitomicaceae bacterium]